MKLKLMTFNTQHCLNYITQVIDFDSFADVIRNSGADIIGLNEMRDQGEDPEYTAQVKELADRLGFHYYFAKAIEFPGGNPYGNGLLSRYPILSTEIFSIPAPDKQIYSGYYETRCLLKAEIDIPGGLTVMAVHFGLNPDEQLQAVETVVDNLESERCILMGDFNLEPADRIMGAIQDRLYDTAELFSRPLLSWPSDVPTQKLDYIFTTRDIRVLSADIPAMVVSDHRPHVALIDIE